MAPLFYRGVPLAIAFILGVYVYKYVNSVLVPMSKSLPDLLQGGQTNVRG